MTKKVKQQKYKPGSINDLKEQLENVENKLRAEIKRAIKKDRYLSKEDAELINQFISKIKEELNEAKN